MLIHFLIFFIMQHENSRIVFPNGFRQVFKALTLGLDVRYKPAVKSITLGKRIAVTTEDETTWRARRLLLTVPVTYMSLTHLNVAQPN
jgi:hypothetical protein